MLQKFISVFCLLAAMQSVDAQQIHVLPLGVYGGLDESNLSAYYMRSDKDTTGYCFDAGSVYSGIAQANRLGTVKKPPVTFFKENIQGYFISHPHLDHIAGLLINSPVDRGKVIYGLPFTIEAIVNHYFTWDTWGNFGDVGDKPALGFYHLQKLDTTETVKLKNSALEVKAFELSHATPHKSTAFLICNKDKYVLCFGDTGPDPIEKATCFKRIWNAVAPLVKSEKLKAIFLEVSFPNAQPDKSLFGHLTPKWINYELTELKNKAGVKDLSQIQFFVTHIKPEGDSKKIIEKELNQNNPLKIKWQFPIQGKWIDL